MKTSELKKIVEENGLGLAESDVRYCVVDKKYMQYADTIKTVQDDFRVQRFCPKVIAQAILDYAYTPLEEREEEKKYKLRVPLQTVVNISFTDDLTLCKNNETGSCFISNRIYSDKEHIQTSFTQKEIDEMPFDTNFFIKEEVK